MCARAKFLAQSSAVLNYLEMGTGAHIWVHVKGGQRALKIFTEKQDDVSEVLKRCRGKQVLSKSVQTSFSSTGLQVRRTREK